MLLGPTWLRQVAKDRQEATADEPMPKRVRLMSMRGREIVGPGYSESASESGMDVEVRRNEKRKPCPGSGSKRAR
jgi:hypothetical protein